MISRKNQILFSILSVIVLFTGGVSGAYGQTPKDFPGPLRTLSGRILWEKSMGVLPSAPRSKTAADNICAQFFVVAVRPEIGDKPIQYDIALEAQPDRSKPDHYACYYEMQVPLTTSLIIYAGMGDGMAWPKTGRSTFHYDRPWIVDGQWVRRESTRREFSPASKAIYLTGKGMNLPFRLVYSQ